MKIKNYLFFFVSFFCTTIHTATNNRQQNSPDEFIFVETPTGVTAYMCDNNTLLDAFFKHEDRPNTNQLIHKNATFFPISAAITVFDTQKKRTKQQIAQDATPRWFIDDTGKKHYGIKAEANCNEPYYLPEEYIYVQTLQALFLKVPLSTTPITQRAESTILGIDEDLEPSLCASSPNGSFSFHSTPLKKQTSSPCQISSTNNSFVFPVSDQNNK